MLFQVFRKHCDLLFQVDQSNEQFKRNAVVQYKANATKAVDVEQDEEDDDEVTYR